MNKSALVMTTYLFIFYRFVVVLFVALAMVALVKLYVVTEINIQETHANLFIHNVLNSKNGISYYDKNIDRIYPMIIDIDDFVNGDLETRLNERMDYGEQHLMAAHFTLFTTEGDEVGSVYYNKEWYEKWIILAHTFWEGKGSAKEYPKNVTVLLLYTDGSKIPGILQFSVVMPNSY